MKEILKVALDVGSSRTRLTVAKIGNQDSAFEILGCGVSNAGTLKAGIVTNIPAITTAIDQAREVAEQESEFKINSMVLSIGGEHILGVNSDGRTPVRNRRISESDISRAMLRARHPARREALHTLHVLKQQFLVDGRPDIVDPRGMVADELEARAHIISARRSLVTNLCQCVRNAGMEIEGVIYAGLASGYAASSPEERDLGICTVDLGAGTADIMLWWHNQPVHAASLPVGGEQVSSTLATTLRVPRQTAEMLKRSYGALYSKYYHHTRISLPSTGHLPDRYIASNDLVEQIAASYQKIFASIGKELQRAGLRKMLDGGIVFTGGAAQMPGLAEMAGEFFNCPVRVFIPPPIPGLDEYLQNDAGMTTTLGLLYMHQYPVEDYLWAREEKDGIIPGIRNFLKRYL